MVKPNRSKKALPGPKRTRGRPRWIPAFIKELENTGSVFHAASKAGVRRESVYEHRNKYPEFEAEWKSALEQANGSLERSAFQRARDGTPSVVTHQGEVCYERDPSSGEYRLDAEGKQIPIVEIKQETSLAIFLLKKRMPDVYGDWAATKDHGAEIGVKNPKTLDEILEAIAHIRSQFDRGVINGDRLRVFMASLDATREALIGTKVAEELESLRAEVEAMKGKAIG